MNAFLYLKEPSVAFFMRAHDTLHRLLGNVLGFAKPYLFSLFCVLLAFQTNWWFASYLHTLPPYLAFIAAIMMTAWYGGLRPAIGAIACSTFLIDYYFIAP